MGLQDKELISRIVVPGDDELSQVEIDQDSLKRQNAQDLLDKVQQHVSKYELDFLCGYLHDDPSLWENVLKKITNYYKLSSLRMFYNASFGNMSRVELAREIKKLLYFLKIEMQQLIVNKKITLETTRDELELMLKEFKAPMLMQWVVRFIDGQSYRLFRAVLFKENSLDYTE